MTALLTNTTMAPAELAVLVEERGLSSLFLGHHTHVPTSTVYPLGGELRPEYRDLYDPLIALSSAASVTSRIELGTGVLLVAQQDPIALAKQVASLDVISSGRMVLGVGYGWNTQAMANHDVDPSTRRRLVRERVEFLKTVWENDRFEFIGDYITVSQAWLGPKPSRTPHPPILLGGAPSPTLFRTIVEGYDGWMPVAGSKLPGAVADLRALAEASGRDSKTLSISVLGARMPDQAMVDHYVQLGIDRLLLPIPPVARLNQMRAPTRKEILNYLDKFAGLTPE